MNKIFGKFTKEHDIPFGKFKHFVQENVFKRNETFYFVNQVSSVDSGFPCMSTEESFDSGKPCSFPFFSKYLHHNCTQYDGDVYPWCWTRVDADRTFANNDPKFWGYCTSNCHGEQFDPSSNHNLANEGYDSFWVSDLYGLKTFCHTFNPKEKLGLDFDFRLGLYLGHQERSSDVWFYNLFLHEKGQFWPRLDWKNQERFVLDKNLSITISFKVVTSKKMKLYQNRRIQFNRMFAKLYF